MIVRDVRSIIDVVVKPSYGPNRTKQTSVIAVIGAAMIVVMMVAQLFAYEDFATVLAGVLPFNDLALTAVTAGVIVVVELLALPYLLSMFLGKLMRVTSALAGIAVVIFWLISVLTNAHASNSALFSTALELPGGLIAALWSLMLTAAVINTIIRDSKFRHDTAS